MSFFDRQGIPENLIRNQAEASTSNIERFDDFSEGETSESDGSPKFKDDITTLRNYSFISISENSTSLSMHRLVQLTMRAWLKFHGQIDQWKERFIINLHKEFPISRYENWGKYRSLFPHVRSAMLERPESRESLLKWATLLYRGAWYAAESGNIEDIKDMAAKSRKQRVKLLGAEDEETLASTAMLATANSLQGRWKEAEKLGVQVMETRKMKLGEGHPDTLTSMANLASTYMHQGQWDEAEKLQVQVMETRKTKLSQDHPDTLSGMVDLALTYSRQGRWEEAESLSFQVMETRKIKFGEDHPDTLVSMSSLASTYGNQGR